MVLEAGARDDPAPITHDRRRHDDRARRTSMVSEALELGAFRVLSKRLDMGDVGRLVRDAFESDH